MVRIEVNVKTGDRKEIPLTPEEIADAQARTTAEEAVKPLRNIERVEMENPITHRALREFFIGFGETQPAFQNTLLYKRVKAVDDAIRAEREKL